MKQKYKIVDKITNKVIEGEKEIRNTFHFNIQKKTRVQIFVPKKGAGSYRRNKKVDDEY